MAKEYDHKKSWQDRQRKKEEGQLIDLGSVRKLGEDEFKKMVEEAPPEGMVATAMTMSMKNLLENMLEANPSEEGQIAVMRHVIGGIEHFKTEFGKIREPLARAQALHQFVDNAIIEDRKDKPNDWAMVTCKAACSNCCHIQVSINEEEAMLLLAADFEKPVGLDWALIQEQAAFRGTEVEYARLGKAKNKCPFLSDTGLCQAYEFRPASCRKYHVANDPADCDAETSKGTMVLGVKQIELAASAMMDLDHTKIGTLAEMLIQAKGKMPMVHCYNCQRDTPTAEQDCTVCGLSKGSRGRTP